MNSEKEGEKRRRRQSWERVGGEKERVGRRRGGRREREERL